MNELFKKIPSMDIFLENHIVRDLLTTYGREYVLTAIRKGIDDVRQSIKTVTINEGNSLEKEILIRTKTIINKDEKMNLRPVLNGTGTILHTNLGRAGLSKKAIEAMVSVASEYSNLELNLETGKRGSRYDHVVSILQELTGCEDAIVVNNNAAAVLLILASISSLQEAIVSRGELVEIGGSFRMPEVMALGGAILKEVGTTNKTHLNDYEESINENTALLVKVHTSNFAIKGFTESVSTKELKEIGEKHKIPVYYDLGSGALYDLKEYGIPNEPTVKTLVEEGLDILSFSGDKLLGGPQAGIILGKKEYIEKMKKHQLLRAFRVDKLTLAALEATLREYLDMDKIKEVNPTIEKLTISKKALQHKVELLYSFLDHQLKDVTVTLIETEALAGGGSLPELLFPSYCVFLEFKKSSLGQRLLESLRKGTPSIMCRMHQDALLIDIRALEKDKFTTIAESIIKEWEALIQ